MRKCYACGTLYVYDQECALCEVRLTWRDNYRTWRRWRRWQSAHQGARSHARAKAGGPSRPLLVGGVLSLAVLAVAVVGGVAGRIAERGRGTAQAASPRPATGRAAAVAPATAGRATGAGHAIRPAHAVRPAHAAGRPPAIVDFALRRDRPSQPYRLAWGTRDATRVTLDGRLVRRTGHYILPGPLRTRTYRLIASNSAGREMAGVRVVVAATPSPSRAPTLTLWQTITPAGRVFSHKP